MYENLIFSKNCLMYFLFIWIMSICNVTCHLCPAVFKGGYIEPSCSRRPEVGCYYYCNHGFLKTRDWLLCGLDGNWVPDTNSVCIKSACKTPICFNSMDLCPSEFNGGYIESSCSRLSGVWCKYYCNPGFVRTGSWLSCGNERNWVPDTNSMCIKSDLCPAVFNGGYLEPSCSRLPGDSCTFYCNQEFVKTGSWLTCGEDGKWIQDTNSICIKSVDLTSSYSESRRTIGGAIAGITTAVLIIMMIIVATVVWISKRSSLRKSQRRVPSHSGGTCLRPRENPDQNITTLRQQPNADGMESVSSFESPSYNGLYVHSFVQRIPKISSSYKYPVPPPSYRETQIATNESPPTYKEVVMDPTRFNLFT